MKKILFLVILVFVFTFSLNIHQAKAYETKGNFPNGAMEDVIWDTLYKKYLPVDWLFWDKNVTLIDNNGYFDGKGEHGLRYLNRSYSSDTYIMDFWPVASTGLYDDV